MNRAMLLTSRSALAALLAPAALVMPVSAQTAPAPDDDDYMGESPERYAQVKFLDGPARIQKGDQEEDLDRGMPVAEGDRIDSQGRGVLQLADGTRIAFAKGARFQVAALFMDKSGERQVLLRLDAGRLRIRTGGQSAARIRVDTPSGTASAGGNAGFTLEVEPDRTARLRVHSGRASFANEADRVGLVAGERLTVYGNQDRLDRVHGFNTYDSDDFDQWCDRTLTIRRGKSWDHVPSEVRYYADDLDDAGDWVFVDDVNTWCWRPSGVSAEWRPYWQGRWGAYGGGMTWVSAEPWGYTTCHFGRWGWHSGWGWYWIPGSFYSPAWVAWNTYDSYFGWAPLGYRNAPCSWGYGAWGGGPCWNVVNVGYVNRGYINRHTLVDVNVFHTFNRGSGGTTWTSNGSGGRPLTPPWQRSPIMVTHAEFSDSSRFRRALGERPVMRDRFQAYERQAQTSTGRTVMRQPAAPQGRPESGNTNPAPNGTRPERGNAPFEDRRRLGSDSGRLLLRESPRPVDPRGNTSAPRTDGPRAQEPSRSEAPRERPRVDEPAPRGQSERPRETRLPERNTREESRPVSRPEVRQEVRPERPVERPRNDPPARIESRPMAPPSAPSRPTPSSPSPSPSRRR